LHVITPWSFELDLKKGSAFSGVAFIGQAYAVAG